MKPVKRQPHICLRCGGHDVNVLHRSDIVDFKGLTLEVDGLAETACRTCDLRWTTPGQEQDNLALLKAAFAAKRDEVRDSEGLLMGSQIAAVLDQLRLSRADAAVLFGGGPNAFGKYIAGEVLQSFAMDRLMRLALAVGPQAVRYLKLGRDAPLKLNAAGYFVAPAVGNATFVCAPSGEEKGGLPVVNGRTTLMETVQG